MATHQHLLEQAAAAAQAASCAPASDSNHQAMGSTSQLQQHKVSKCC
jgi:hypothetical protein